MVKRKKPRKRRAKKADKTNQTFIIFAVVIFVGSIVGYALLSGGTLGFGKGKGGEAGEPPTDRKLAENMRNPYPVDEAFLAKGNAIYQEKCVACHLPDGSGPENHPISVHGRHHSPGDYLWLATYGIPGSAMKGYKKELTLEERWQVLTYMRREFAGTRE